MDVEPVLIGTSAGAVGAVITTPRGEHRGAVAIFPGAGATRAGLNQVWATLAISLAALGVSSLRLDYPGTGESHLCRTDRWQEGTAETVDWFRKRTPGLRLGLVAHCGGLLPAYQEVMRDPARVSGLGLVTPPVTAAALVGQPTSLNRRLRNVAGKARGLAQRARYGQPDVDDHNVWPGEISLALAHASDMLVDISARVPLWVLSTAADPATNELTALKERLTNGVAYELELAVPARRGGRELPGEREIVACATAWVSRNLGLAGKPGLPAPGRAAAPPCNDGLVTKEELR
jgi:alpha-beta hydrolase superfamily lysophospholipase